MGQKKGTGQKPFFLTFLPAASLGQEWVRAMGRFIGRARPSKQILPCDSPVTLDKVRALGSYYTAAAFFPGD